MPKSAPVCVSCKARTISERLRAALSTLGVVREIEIDAADDSARMQADLGGVASHAAVDSTLLDASVGSGHEYRVPPGSRPALD